MYLNKKRSSPRHIILRLSKVNDKELKAAMGKKKKESVAYKGNPNRLLADFSAETLWVSGKQNDILKLSKKKKKAASQYPIWQNYPSDMTYIQVYTYQNRS